jgi:hypothetical protein
MTGDTLLLHDCRDRLELERLRMTQEIDKIRTARSILDNLLAAPTTQEDASPAAR